MYSEKRSSVSNGHLKVVFVGAHPDDPETGCGGTIAKLVGDGHHVTVIYLTRGEAGLKSRDRITTARLRTAEALNAAEILGVDVVFANQIDGQTSADAEHSGHFTNLLRSLMPDIVFSHWQYDTHRDHQNVSKLTRIAWDALDRTFTLVYYEVMAGIQTYDFEPNVYVDVSGAEQKKRAAVYAHVSQNPDRFYPYHVNMEKLRGAEARLARAEAFFMVRQSQRHLSFFSRPLTVVAPFKYRAPDRRKRVERDNSVETPRSRSRRCQIACIAEW